MKGLDSYMNCQILRKEGVLPGFSGDGLNWSQFTETNEFVSVTDTDSSELKELNWGANHGIPDALERATDKMQLFLKRQKL